MAWSPAAQAQGEAEPRASAPATPEPREQRTAAASRLFEREAKTPDSEDLANFYQGVRSIAEIRRAGRQAELQRTVLVVLCCAQMISGIGGYFYVDEWSPMTVEVRLIQVTLMLIAVSGALGFMGAWKLSSSFLQAFFITQIWALTTAFSQFIAEQRLVKRRNVFCSGRDNSPGCIDGEKAAEASLALGLVLVLVYVSLFSADGLSERLQDQLEEEDQQKLVKFVRNMSTMTWQKVYYFEDNIHKEYQKLIDMGYLTRKRN